MFFKETAEKVFGEGGFLHSFSQVSRPLAVTLVVAVPAMGGCSVGVVSAMDAAAGAAMAANTTTFFSGIPDALYGLIGALGLGYFGAKAYETRTPPPPVGRPSPEARVTHEEDDEEKDAPWTTLK